MLSATNVSVNVSRVPPTEIIGILDEQVCVCEKESLTGTDFVFYAYLAGILNLSRPMSAFKIYIGKYLVPAEKVQCFLQKISIFSSFCIDHPQENSL